MLWSEKCGGPGGQVCFWEERDPDLEGDLHLTDKRLVLDSRASHVTVTRDAIGTRIRVTHDVWGGRVRRDWEFVDGDERVDCAVESSGVSLPDGLLLVRFPVSTAGDRRIFY